MMENIDDTAVCAGSESYQTLNAVKQTASNDASGGQRKGVGSQ
jgi:hypothetical protein